MIAALERGETDAMLSRGAGNLLGAKQHGHMEAVGYDLYCKMLDEAIKHRKGEEVRPDFDTLIGIQCRLLSIRSH